MYILGRQTSPLFHELPWKRLMEKVQFSESEIDREREKYLERILVRKLTFAFMK
jgi:hypothetical protein